MFCLVRHGESNVGTTQWGLTGTFQQCLSSTTERLKSVDVFVLPTVIRANVNINVLFLRRSVTVNGRSNFCRYNVDVFECLAVSPLRGHKLGLVLRARCCCLTLLAFIQLLHKAEVYKA